MAQIRVAPNTANELLITPDQIESARFRKTHTGTSVFNGSVEAGLNLEDRTLDELWLEKDDGSLLFRGQLQKVNTQEGQGITPSTDIKGHGIAYKLERSETVFTVNNELAHNAIARFWTDETEFTPTVTTPSINNTTTGTTAQEASTTSEFESVVDVADTDPINITTDEIQLLQSSFTQEGEDGTEEDTLTNTQADYSDGIARGFNDGGFIEWTFTNTYTIPEFEIYYRNDATGGDVADVTWSLDGEEIGQTNEQLMLTWNGVYNATGTEKPTVQPGTHTVRAEATPAEIAESFTANHGTPVALVNTDIVNGSETVTDGSVVFSRGTDYEMDYSNGEITTLSGGNMVNGNSYDIEYQHFNFADSRFIDVLAPLDDSFSYTFDNDNGGSSGYLDGPEHYPVFDVVFNLATTSWNITDGTLTTTFDDTTNGQRIQLRLSDQTYFPNDGTENNTTSITTNFGTEVGSAIQGRATLSRYGTRTTATPQTGFNGQHLQSWTITFDGNDIPVFSGSNTFEGTQFEVAQRIHNRSRMRFTLEHDKTTLPVESYRPEDNVKALPTLDESSRSTRKDEQNFANHVTVRGKREEGTRLSHTVQDDASVNDRGIEHYDVKDPSLDDLTAIKVTARSTLIEKLREQIKKGDIEIAPKNIPPGYGRPNPFDSDDDPIPIEETSYEIRQGTIMGNLKLDYRTGELLAESQSTVRQSTQNNALGF